MQLLTLRSVSIPFTYFITFTLTSMRTFTKHFFVALLGTAFLASCSRPVAYFQPTARQQFKPVKTEAIAVTPAEATKPAVVEALNPQAAVVAQAATTEQIAQAKQAVSQVEAYVRNDNQLASNKKLTKRLARVKELLSNTNANTASVKAPATKKSSLMHRVMLKQLDKKIKNHLSPERAMAKSLLTIGLIVGVIGLLLIILNVASPLGIIALVVGLALVLVDLLR